jgi:hypothetical protein
MIHVHALVFITLLELVVVFAALWLVWFFKVRTLMRRQEVLRSTSSDEQAAHGDGAYFVKELVATRAQIDILAKDGPDVPLTGLKLRAAYLDIEREFAQGQQRDVAFWTNVQERVDAIRIEHAPVLPPSAPATYQVIEQVDADATEAGDPQTVKHLIDTQVSTITELKEALSGVLGQNPRGAEIIAKVEKLGRTNREMSLCVLILEGDNSFLRDKLKEAGVELG